MNISPQEYNREERHSLSWRHIRHHGGADQNESIRHSRRITLLDLVLLVILMGVLVPWVFHIGKQQTLGPYNLDMDEQKIDEISHYIAKISLDENASVEEDITQIGIKVFNRSGLVIHESWDIPPDSGQVREFIYRDTEGQAATLKVFAGSYTTVLELTTDDE